MTSDEAGRALTGGVEGKQQLRPVLEGSKVIFVGSKEDSETCQAMVEALGGEFLTKVTRINPPNVMVARDVTSDKYLAALSYGKVPVVALSWLGACKDAGKKVKPAGLGLKGGGEEVIRGRREGSDMMSGWGGGGGTTEGLEAEEEAKGKEEGRGAREERRQADTGEDSCFACFALMAWSALPLARRSRLPITPSARLLASRFAPAGSSTWTATSSSPWWRQEGESSSPTSRKTAPTSSMSPRTTPCQRSSRWPGSGRCRW